MATEKRAFLLQQWSEIIQARVASGKCIRHWCNEHGVRENQYYYWLRELQKEHYDESVQGLHADETAVVPAGTSVIGAAAKTEVNTFVELSRPGDGPVVNGAVMEHRPAAVVRAGEIEVDIFSDTPEECLRRLIAVLRDA